MIIAQNNRPNRSFGPKNKKDAQHRINEYITAQVVRVVGDNLEPQIVSLREALAIADERGVDLVEISPQANPPVCKILDYNKYVYEQGKKASEAKKKQAKVTLKELRIKSHIAEHDLEVRMRQIEEFLRKKNQVRFVVVFHGRENQHKDIGIEILNNAAKRLEPLATVDGGLQSLGNRMSMTFVPKV